MEGVLALGGQPKRWSYEPERPKRKHHWEHPRAGFVDEDGFLVGKCPSGFAEDLAEALVNEGIPWSPERWGKPWPKRIYVVHDGVVYRATPTVPGVSYHGFPELPAELRNLPGSFLDTLLARARDLGCEEQVRAWMEQ